MVNGFQNKYNKSSLLIRFIIGAPLYIIMQPTRAKVTSPIVYCFSSVKFPFTNSLRLAKIFFGFLRRLAPSWLSLFRGLAHTYGRPLNTNTMANLVNGMRNVIIRSAQVLRLQAPSRIAVASAAVQQRNIHSRWVGLTMPSLLHNSRVGKSIIFKTKKNSAGKITGMKLLLT